jgi:hypothetical protein
MKELSGREKKKVLNDLRLTVEEYNNTSENELPKTFNRTFLRNLLNGVLMDYDISVKEIDDEPLKSIFLNEVIPSFPDTGFSGIIPTSKGSIFFNLNDRVFHISLV